MSYFASPFDYSIDATVKKYTLWLVISDEMKSQAQYQFTKKEFPANDNAGYDLVTAENWDGKDLHLLDLGVKAMMTYEGSDETVHYWLAPRSSIYKTGYIMGNSLGVIDRTYRGAVKAPVIRVLDQAKGFVSGDRHFQILAPDMGWIHSVRIVDSLPETKRGEGGFGSTGA